MVLKKNFARNKKGQGSEDTSSSIALKERPIIDIDDSVPIASIEEKDEDVLTTEVEDAEDAEDENMAEEELDPFGDKWEE